MAATMKRSDYFATEDGQDVMQRLRDLAANVSHNTPASYSANSEEYPDNMIPFIDKHVNYLNTHPKVDARMYVANLQLMTRLRR